LAERALASRESFFLAAKLIVGLVTLTVAALLVWGAAQIEVAPTTDQAINRSLLAIISGFVLAD